jgi:hypothetical protein
MVSKHGSNYAKRHGSKLFEVMFELKILDGIQKSFKLFLVYLFPQIYFNIPFYKIK